MCNRGYNPILLGGISLHLYLVKGPHLICKICPFLPSQKPKAEAMNNLTQFFWLFNSAPPQLPCDFENSGALKRSSFSRKIHHPWRPPISQHSQNWTKPPREIQVWKLESYNSIQFINPPKSSFNCNSTTTPSFLTWHTGKKTTMNEFVHISH